MSAAYQEFKNQIAELGGSDIPHREITYWDIQITPAQKTQILKACGFTTTNPQTAWVHLGKKQRDAIKQMIRRRVEWQAGMLGLRLVPNDRV